MTRVASRLQTLAAVYRSWKFLLLNIVVAIAYYYLFQLLILLSTRGLIIDTAPTYLVFLLDLSASIVITLSVFGAIQGRSRKTVAASASSSAVGTASVLAAGITAGCACQAPVLYGLLYFFGLNALEASGLVALVDEYQVAILASLIILNTIVIFLTLSRIHSRTYKRMTRSGN